MGFHAHDWVSARVIARISAEELNANQRFFRLSIDHLPLYQIAKEIPKPRA